MFISVNVFQSKPAAPTRRDFGFNTKISAISFIINLFSLRIRGSDQPFVVIVNLCLI